MMLAFHAEMSALPRSDVTVIGPRACLAAAVACVCLCCDGLSASVVGHVLWRVAKGTCSKTKKKNATKSRSRFRR